VTELDISSAAFIWQRSVSSSEMSLPRNFDFGDRRIGLISILDSCLRCPPLEICQLGIASWTRIGRLANLFVHGVSNIIPRCYVHVRTSFPLSTYRLWRKSGKSASVFAASESVGTKTKAGRATRLFRRTVYFEDCTVYFMTAWPKHRFLDGRASRLLRSGMSVP